ncbi:MAG TPA: TatD family hydrolase [Flavobacterium sp.]|uniref:TatD family hydrolase n=1 Tax=Flavobacterium sp. TaxID=239 RepID=UPI002CB41711|nr:TatD family hydrolase [Flavobacterium sp.]MCA0350058.1 TatD family hydrolase [Bacteroidota bacterium]HPW97690.1 TatD family hydrolase [Flavobacterium sp.]HQA75422.1 TatD family hydrolase [Flavobacterium sp.]
MKYYNLHTHTFTNNPKVVELVNQYPWEFDNTIPQYSIGIHPWHIDENRLKQDLKTIEEKLALPECLALGECGLDKRIEIPIALQLEVFEHQIVLAEKFKKPLLLHLVAAYDELIALNKRLKISVPVVLHGFSKNEQVAKQLLDNGFYLSFGKYLLRNPELKTVFQSIPNDRFFLETDMIEETLEEVYVLAANYKGIDLEEMKTVVATNWKNVFKNTF